MPSDLHGLQWWVSFVNCGLVRLAVPVEDGDVARGQGGRGGVGQQGGTEDNPQSVRRVQASETDVPSLHIGRVGGPGVGVPGGGRGGCGQQDEKGEEEEEGEEDGVGLPVHCDAAL